MKMRVGTRIVFSVLMLAIIAACVCVELIAFNVIDAVYLEMLYYGFTGAYTYIWVIAAAVIGVICLCLLFFGIIKKKPSAVKIGSEADGEVVITIEAFRELVLRYINTVSCVAAKKISVKPGTLKQVKLKLELAAKPNTNIPEAVSEIKAGLAEYLMTYTGVTCNEATVIITPYKQPNS